MVSKEIKTGVVYDNDSPRDAKRNKKERERGRGERSMQTHREVRLERVAESGFAIRRDVYSAYLASLECEFNKVNKSF